MPRLVRRHFNLTPAGPAINVALLKDILLVPPVFFTVRDKPNSRRRQLVHDPTKITLCSRYLNKKHFPSSPGGCLKVSTEAELDELTERLLRLPIFLTASVERRYKLVLRNVTRVTKENVVVIINTQNAQINDYIKTMMARAKKLMQEGKRFSVEFDFHLVLTHWMEGLFVDEDRSSMGWANYTSKHDWFTVTNHREKSRTFTSHCMDSAVSVLGWALCCPCYLLMCPIYRISRSMRVTDIGGIVPEELFPTTSQPYIKVNDEEAASLALLNTIVQQSCVGLGGVLGAPQ